MIWFPPLSNSKQLKRPSLLDGQLRRWVRAVETARLEARHDLPRGEGEEVLRHLRPGGTAVAGVEECLSLPAPASTMNFKPD